MSVEQYLYLSFGDSTPVPQNSHFDIQFNNFYYGQTATLTLRADLRNAHNNRISAAAPFQLQNLLSLEINQQKFPLIATQMIGEMEAQVPAQEVLNINLFCEKLCVFSQSYKPVDSFQQCARGQLQQNKITALASSSFYSARVLQQGTGQYAIRLVEPSLVGVCLNQQRHVVFGAVMGGEIVLQCDGKALRMNSNEMTKTIDGIDGEDVVMFVRLKAGKVAEML